MGTCMACKAEIPLWAHFCGVCGRPCQPQVPASASVQPHESRLMAAIPTSKSSTKAFTPSSSPATPLPTTGPYIQRAWGPILLPLPLRSHKPQQRGQWTPTKWAIILLILIVIAVGSGVLAYLLTRPQPVLSLISSTYHVGTIPAGSNGTTLRVQGQHFSAHSAITFLLDNHPAPAAPAVVSNQFGALSTTLPITAAWPLGLHTLTARDAANYVSKRGIQVEIVAQGQAHTPGPNGAPPDDTSFNMRVSVREQTNGSDTSAASMDTLLVSGNPDPAGGSVCKSRDNMQPHTYNSSTTSGLPDTLVYTFSCSGTYKNGRISYKETLVKAVITISNQGNLYVCRLLKAGVDEQLSGNYTKRGNFTGSVTLSAFPSSDFSCTTGQLSYFNFSLLGGSGTWSATYTPKS